MRIVLPGILAGLVGAFFARVWMALRLAAWNLPGWTKTHPAATENPPWLELALEVGIGLVVFVAGWTAARWSWAPGKGRSFVAGMTSGLLAGAIFYLYPAQFWAILEAQRSLLETAAEVITQDDGRVLVYASSLMTWAQLIRWLVVCLFGSMLIGGIGGWASALLDGGNWGFAPEPPGWIERLPVYALTLSGAATFFAAGALFPIFESMLIDSISKLTPENLEIANRINLEQVSSLRTFFWVAAPYLLAFLGWMLPLLFSLGWLLRRARAYRIRHWVGWALWFGGWVLFAIRFGAPLLQILVKPSFGLLTFQNAQIPIGWLVLIPLLLLAALILLLGWGVAPEIDNTGAQRSTSSGFFAAVLVFSVIAAVQWMSSVGTFGIAEWGLLFNLNAHLFDGEKLPNIAFYLTELERALTLFTLSILALQVLGFLALSLLTALARAVGKRL